MGLFSFLHKNKQDAAPGKSEYRSQADEPFTNTRTRAKRTAGNAGNSTNKDNDADPMLPEKKRARRRLIGAVVLVLAVVIVLPMILDPEPKPLTDDISIQIPSRDAKAPDSAPAPESAAPAVSAPASAPAGTQSDVNGLDGKEELVETKPVVKPTEKPAETPVAKPVDATLPIQPIPKPVEKPAPKQIEKPIEKPTPKPEKIVEKPAEKPAPVKAEKAAPAAAKTSEEQRALAILQGKAPATDKSTGAYVPNGKFVIQVAALATQEKIDELRSKLSAAGLKSFTQKIATKDGDRTRIRVGPFDSREEADKARAKIVKLGLNATLVPT
jgi:DedD protein